jgi:hypothetical protein
MEYLGNLVFYRWLFSQNNGLHRSLCIQKLVMNLEFFVVGLKWYKLISLATLVSFEILISSVVLSGTIHEMISFQLLWMRLDCNFRCMKETIIISMIIPDFQQNTIWKFITWYRYTY